QALKLLGQILNFLFADNPGRSASTTALAESEWADVFVVHDFRCLQDLVVPGAMAPCPDMPLQ
ncbi:MAG TPA: hypothetical protein VF749_08940, partial [Candidatus Acidoferrum sp.]